MMITRILIVFLFLFLQNTLNCRAQDSVPNTGQQLWTATDAIFMETIGRLKNPFNSSLPKVIENPVVDPVQSVNSNLPLVVPVLPPVVNVVLPEPPETINPPTLHLQGVVWGKKDQENQAIVDETVVSVGGEINGAKVTSITREGIVVLYKGQSFTFKAE